MGQMREHVPPPRHNIIFLLLYFIPVAALMTIINPTNCIHGCKYVTHIGHRNVLTFKFSLNLVLMEY